jgi:hypothetical protein
LPAVAAARVAARRVARAAHSEQAGGDVLFDVDGSSMADDTRRPDRANHLVLEPPATVHSRLSGSPDPSCPRAPILTPAADGRRVSVLPAKFVNRGSSSRTDVQHLLRPILKQTVSYRLERGRDVDSHGTGWVERIVADEPEMSTYFTPIAITINVDSFEHLEFETRPDQLLVYTLVQGDERWSSSSTGAVTEGTSQPA